MAEQTHVYEFVFNDQDIAVPIDESNAVIQGYSNYSVLNGDAAFYAELNKVLSNLHLIRRAHPQIGILVSFVADSNGNSYKVSLA